ncbi:MAG: exonuclease domain-containing protein [Enterococcus lemanii]|jgi:DNA polymerase-3 subunit epsilon
MSINFVAIDFETANQSRASACSVGMIKVLNGEIVDSYYSLINPETEFDPYNTYIHGITSEMVENQPTYANISNQILDFSESLPLVAHYAPFDMGVIRDSNDRYEITDFKVNYFDSYYLSRQLIQSLSYRLNDLSSLLKFDLDHHNALSDAEACAKIILYLCETHSANNIDELNKLGRYFKLGVVDGSLGSGFRRKKDSKKNAKGYDINALLDSIDKDNLDKAHPFYETRACFTGKLQSMTRINAMEVFASYGGIPEKSVTKSTNYLVMGEQDLNVIRSDDGKSSKVKRAEKLLSEGQDVQLIGEQQFLQMLS